MLLKPTQATQPIKHNIYWLKIISDDHIAESL